MKVFPFTVYAVDNGHYIQNPWHYRATFAKYKPDDLTWYAYDIELKSRVEAKFTVYGMRDFCHGGIGEVICTFECCVEDRDTVPMVEKRIKDMALKAEKDEYELRRLLRRKEIEEKIRSSLK